MTLIAMLTAMGVVLWIIKIPIPNVQPVTDMVMIITLVMGVGFGFTLAVLIMLVSNLVLGFGIWTIPQILAYAVCVLTVAALAKVTPLKKHFIYQVVVAGFLGYEYGFIVSIGMSIYGGLSAFFAYWLSGLTFDSFHAIGNVVIYMVLAKPLEVALNRYFNRT